MYVVRSYLSVVLCIMVLVEIINQIFEARCPAYLEMAAVDLIYYPKIAHVHGSGALALDGAVDDTIHRCIVAY